MIIPTKADDPAAIPIIKPRSVSSSPSSLSGGEGVEGFSLSCDVGETVVDGVVTGALVDCEIIVSLQACKEQC